MSFVLSMVLVAVAAVLVLVGAIASSSTLLVAAAFVSGIAVVILWRRSVAEREDPFVTDEPLRTQPDWSRDRLIEKNDERHTGEMREINLGGSRDVAIAGYDDLVAAEVLPALETLSVEELRAVIVREEHGLQRISVIDRARRLIELTATPTTGPVERVDATGPVPRVPGQSRRAEQKSLQNDGPGFSL